MKIYYYSIAGNIRRFLANCQLDAELLTASTIAAEPFVLVTNTLGFGEVPAPVSAFLRNNHRHLIAVASSGNRNWGANFARASDLISEQYNVPIILKFELSGTEEDTKYFTERVRCIDETYRVK
ncbi:ribonucleotide reductase stimulatory protein [Niallia circulans]|uniref:class Ib ribonucleoside-diphosphate reductase assembly flavoprotein NrdI n=1 Tax=Niallia TaxID=2837506 RepID=UPI00077C13A1|nr:class Ib ribonucleoside-diphosphate reductase assembly flavoprotein NrdI [Niallia circulans]MDR4318707.1 class Ib ribonucleoside-diphosphate reductase assembly flavoprotein NrdI [Niallia circulans]MED3839332.1 class Ib ribonucleoside-diphosphate reductase assembly flavoprotein NrdI [Niallia circulans]MED4245315.1 class Ib ribonucleoside-diphosphate reductase assembly flavoprotein NrdI [Niallia circulans]MED4250850.1 class Ib ribonucleoside-diphosphate reductase assembly flavoprotein NrdI [Ni